MADNDLSLPPRSGGKVYGEMRSRIEEAADESHSGSGLRRQFWIALAASIVAGCGVGLSFGERTGVRPAIEAGTRPDAARSVRAGGGEDAASLTEELRALRAQIEQMRHLVENQRATERLKALEASQNAGQEATQTLEKAAAALTSRVDDIDRRLTRLVRAGVDFTPVGATGRNEPLPQPGKTGMKKAR
ncbi:hypothetical protein [Methylocystis heyeri]|uniref:Uncharacterized protein n=1 Tax=Methylocystis heyeri TaxID=391905 RepID=A0A6B8KIN2_9HYPH|nr:hypothetical protein [Methylocystis heyeri]QGM46911.1 hypothetical protein H2LOC_015090 [Methylocystis heyeri]